MRRILPVMALLTAASCALAQEKPAELKEDLWFKVTKAGDESKYLGFVHLTIATVTADGKTLYHYYEEQAVSDVGLEVGVREDYWFDTDMVLERGESLWRAGEGEVNVKAVFDGRVLTRACVTPAIEQVTPWSRDRACWPVNMIPLALMRKEGPWEAGREMDASTFGFDTKVIRDAQGKETVEFLLIEPALVYVVKGQAKKQVVDLEQTCWLLEAVQKDRPQAGIVSIVVDGRGFPVEILNSRYVIRRVKDDVAARNGNKFVWAHGGRRDPFRHPMKPKEVKKIQPGKPVEPVDDKMLSRLLQDAQAALDAMTAASNLPDAEKEKILARKNSEIMSAAAKIRNSGNIQAIQKINDIVAAAGKLYDPVRAALASAKALLKDIEEKYRTGERELLMKITPLVDQLRSIAQSPDLSGRPEQPQVNAMLAKAAEYEKRAKTKMEGQDKTKELIPNGIMYVLSPRTFEVQLGLGLLGARITAKTEVTLPVSESIVLMGGGSYAEGDPLKEIEDCVVKQIRQSEVDLDYKGETITLPLGVTRAK